jgi:hypothetical protein
LGAGNASGTKKDTMRSDIDLWMTRLSYVYIVLPFLLFAFFWLNFFGALVFGGTVLAGLVFALKRIDPWQFVRLNRGTVFWVVALVLILVFFSGIGSYTYQNEDFPYRNALFSDLIKYPWPVMYQVEGFEGHFLNGKETIMTYYLGYYLPAAGIGKVFGPGAGQFALYLWTVLGVLIVLYQVGKYVQKFTFPVVAMFFAWGTLFFVGALLKYPLEKFGTEGNYLWAGMRLYANSNLGSIYWIFNQSLTAWPIMLLILNKAPLKNAIFLYSFCLFLSPFCFVGFLPFFLYYLLQHYRLERDLLDFVKSAFSFQNVLAALAVVSLTYFYLQSNKAGQKFHYIPWSSIKVFVAFMFLSWGLIALLLFPKFRKEPLYWIAVLVLIPLPFFQQGNGMDFPGRVSMPAFLVLLLLAIRLVLEERRALTKRAMVLYFVVSGVAHFIFETGTSMWKTGYANLSYRTNLDEFLLQSEHPKWREMGEELKTIKHKDVLTRDPFKTVTHPSNPVIWNYMADTEHSFFYQYLAKKREP